MPCGPFRCPIRHVLQLTKGGDSRENHDIPNQHLIGGRAAAGPVRIRAQTRPVKSTLRLSHRWQKRAMPDQGGSMHWM